MNARVMAYICVDGAADAIAFYERAFGARERCRLPVSEGGPLGHAEIAIGDSVLFLADEYPPNNWRSPASLGANSASIMLAVDDCEAAMQRAIDAGATLERPVADQPGARGGWIVDPFGHRWNIMTPNPDFFAT